MKRKVIYSHSTAMTEQEIAKVFEILHLETDEDRQAARFRPAEIHLRPAIQITVADHTGMQITADLATSCPPSVKL